MSHKIYHVYSDIKNTEDMNADLLITRISYQKDTNEFNKKTVNSHVNHLKNLLSTK